MKYLVIGTFIRDEIFSDTGEASQSMGGLCHTLSPMIVSADSDDQIIPLCYIGEDLREDIKSFFDSYRILSNKGLFYLDQPNNKVLLEYYNKNERIEKSLYPLPSLTFDLIEPMLDVDIIVINMISGWELSLHDLRKIRAGFEHMIIMDMHSLSLGRNEDGSRFYRAIPDFCEWFSCCDIVQMNEFEFENLGGDLSDIRSFIETNDLPEQLIFNITRGEKGSLTITKKDQYFDILRMSPDDRITVIDPTGCGDVFLGAFAVVYQQSGNIEKSVQKANKLAAISGMQNGFSSPAYLMEQMKFYQDII